MLFVVMHLGNEAIAVHMIKAQTQIQRGKAQIIRAEESQRGLGGIHRRHESLFANDRDLFFRVVQHDPADPLTNAQSPDAIDTSWPHY